MIIHFHIRFVATCCLISTMLHQSRLLAQGQIFVENNSDQPAYVVCYDSSGKRTADPVEIAAHGTGTISAPPYKLFKLAAPVVVASTQKEELSVKNNTQLYQRAVISKSTKKVLIDTCGTSLSVTAQENTDAITIHNKTEHKIFAAVYYDDGTIARRWGSPVALLAGNAASLVRPERKCKNPICLTHFDRNTYIASAETELLPVLNSKAQPFANIGSLRGDSLYILDVQDKRTIMNELGWQTHLAQTTIENIVRPQLETIKTRMLTQDFPGKNKIATVTYGTTMSPEEATFRDKRFEKTIYPACAKAYKAQYGKELPKNAKLPTIALCVSGGGCRAMIAMGGFLAEMERADTLPLLMYITTLSGSTWHLAGWLQSGLSAQAYYEQLVGQLQNGITNKFALENVQAAVLRKSAFEQGTSIVDVYGALLADKFLKPYAPLGDPNTIFWGSAQPRVENAEVPFPLFTAATPKQFSDTDLSSDAVNYYHWLTFDPYRVELIGLKASIPSWALGRRFSQGTSQDMIPPLSLSNLLGIWGAAMSMNVGDATRLVVGSLSSDVSEQVSTIITQNDTLKYLVQQRTSPAKLPNFAGDGLMTIVDAGLSLIFPFPSLVSTDRKPDIIITLDVSAAVKLAPSLRSAQRYVETNNIPFPTIDLGTIGKKIYTVLWDHKKDAPIIIHVPLIGRTDYHNNWDPESALFTNTFNFTYTKAQAQLLGGLAERMAQDTTKDLVETVVTWIHEHELS